MKTVRLSDIDIHTVGVSLQMVGAIYSDGRRTLLVPFADDKPDLEREPEVLDLSKPDWDTFLRQADHMEVETAVPDPSGNGEIIKAMVRKSQRQIDQNVTWKVYRRDGVRCRYCGADDVPLTVDHLITWETGGPSTEDNLVTACRRCNRTRGNDSIETFLRSDYYKKVSRGLIGHAIEENAKIPGRLHLIHRQQRRGR